MRFFVLPFLSFILAPQALAGFTFCECEVRLERSSEFDWLTKSVRCPGPEEGANAFRCEGEIRGFQLLTRCTSIVSGESRERVSDPLWNAHMIKDTLRCDFR